MKVSSGGSPGAESTGKPFLTGVGGGEGGRGIVVLQAITEVVRSPM